MVSVFRVICVLGRSSWCCGLLLVLLACNGTEPDYPEFTGPAPTVSHFIFSGDSARAVIRDSQGAITIGRSDYTYVFSYREGSTESQVSFARDWSWTPVDELTWRVTVQIWYKRELGGIVACRDLESNVQLYQCGNDGQCIAVEEPV